MTWRSCGESISTSPDVCRLPRKLGEHIPQFCDPLGRMKSTRCGFTYEPLVEISAVLIELANRN